MGVAVGDPAPHFSLPGVDGSTGEGIEVDLADLRGNPVVIAFYPADDSPVCSAQLGDYTAQIAAFADVGAQVLAISPQSPESHRAFAEAQGGFAFPLLCDEDRSVGRAYGNLGLLDLYRRCTYVVDGGGRIAWLHRAIGVGLTYSPVERLVEVLDGLG